MTDNLDTSVHPEPTKQDAHHDHGTEASATDPTAPADRTFESEPDAGAEESPTTTAAAQPASPSPLPSNMPLVENDSDTETLPSVDADQFPVDNRPRQRQVTWAWTSLQAMFPDFDEAVLISVLESVGGDQERAIDTLLGMSDPNYVSVSQTAQPTAPGSSQTDLDEQLARRLMLEEQMEHQVLAPLPPQHVPVPYDARVQRGRPPQQHTPPSGERDTMAEFQEQFNKIAETGKKTFGSLISKVKAKMSEFEQPRAEGPATSYETQPRWDAAGANAYPQRQSYPSYYDPNPPIEQSRPVQGYEISTPQPPIVASDPVHTASKAIATPTNPSSETSDSLSQLSSTATETPPPPQTNTGTPSANIDPGKLGLLPKRPVSLLQPVPAPKRQDSEDDELEYVENPFEEGDK